MKRRYKAYKNKVSEEIFSFKSPSLFRKWLIKNHKGNNGFWLRIFEKYSGEKTVSYQDALEEALCFGWIDGQKKNFDEKSQQDILMNYRLAFCGHGEVNWCEALGTVLANDEVVNGVSERGGHPVVKKKLRQWYLRITEYADRLLEGLERIEFSEAMKEMQSKKIATAEEVVRYLTSVLRGETTAEVVVVEGVGEGCSSARRMYKAPDEKERLKAAELLGKRYGIFSEKLNVDLSLIHI